MFKALGDKNRLRIINMLTHKSLCVCEINSVLPLSQSTVSGHLRVLKEADLVVDAKDGLWVEYSLNTSEPLIQELLNHFKTMMSMDPQFLHDIQLVRKADRNVICRK